MAEYCKECAKNILLLSENELRRAEWSKELDLCEGCGQMKRVLIKLRPSILERIFSIIS